MADLVLSNAVSRSIVFEQLDALRARCGLSADDFALFIREYVKEIPYEEDANNPRRTQSAPGSLTPHSDRADSVASVTSSDSPISDFAHSFIQTDESSKYDTFVYPSGNIDDFHNGLSARIGFPHLEFFAAMEQEHCHLAGAHIEFTTRNYGIRTTPYKEWCYVVAEKPQKCEPPADQLRHDRLIPDISEKMKSPLAKAAGLRKEEVIAICLYTGSGLLAVSAFRGAPSVYDSLSHSLF